MCKRDVDRSWITERDQLRAEVERLKEENKKLLRAIYEEYNADEPEPEVIPNKG